MSKKKRTNPHEDPRYVDITHETRANMLAGLRNIESVKGHKAMRTMNRCLASLEFTKEERLDAENVNWKEETTRMKFSLTTVQDLIAYNEEIPWTGQGAEMLFPFIDALHEAKEAVPGDACFYETPPEDDGEDDGEDVEKSANGETSEDVAVEQTTT